MTQSSLTTFTEPDSGASDPPEGEATDADSDTATDTIAAHSDAAPATDGGTTASTAPVDARSETNEATVGPRTSFGALTAQTTDDATDDVEAARTPGASAPVPDIAPYDDPRAGDVVYLQRRDMHAWLRPSGRGQVDVVWLDGYAPGMSSETIDVETLAKMKDRGVLGIVAQAVEDPWERWGLGAPSEGHIIIREPDASVNNEYPVKIGPRRRVSALQLSRERSRNIVSGFLEHPVIDHKRGGYQYANAAFGARHTQVGATTGPLCAVTTLTRPSSTELCKGVNFDLWDTPQAADDDSEPATTRTLSAGRTRELTRYASHPEIAGDDDTVNGGVRRENTASWLISHAMQWAALEGFETVVSYSGVANQNEGTIYKAANFRYAGTVDANGDGWTNRSDRDQWSNSREKSRWIAELRPEGSVEPRANRRNSLPVAEYGGLPDEAPGIGDLRMTREETIKRDFGRATDFLTEHGTFSDTTPVIDEFCTCTAEKLSNCTCNPAIFGANYNDKLIAAVGGREHPTESNVFHIGVHADAGTAYPGQAAGWLLAKVRDWAHYEGYRAVRIPDTVFPSLSAPQSVGFGETEDGYEHLFDSPLPVPDRESHRVEQWPYEYYR